MLRILALFLTCLGTFAGCKTNQSSDGSRYVYLEPETGSNIRRRVRINADGTTNDAPSSVKSVSGSNASSLERNTRGTSSPSGRQ